MSEVWKKKEPPKKTYRHLCFEAEKMIELPIKEYKERRYPVRSSLQEVDGKWVRPVRECIEYKVKLDCPWCGEMELEGYGYGRVIEYLKPSKREIHDLMFFNLVRASRLFDSAGEDEEEEEA